MLAIEVTVNGKKVALAGACDLGVLTGIVSATGALGPDSAGTKTNQTEKDLTLRVGGLTSRSGGKEDEHLTWVKTDLIVGDIVTFRVVETETPDQHMKESSAGGNMEELSERQLYEMAKQEYERLKDKYG